MDVLIIQLRQLGDILLTVPCAREIKKAWPHAKITFLCHRMGEPLLRHSPYIDTCITYKDGESLKLLGQRLKLLRASRFAYAFDFMNNPRSLIYTFLSGAHKTLSFGSVRSGFYSQTVPRPTEPEYIVATKHRLLAAIGIEAHDLSLTLTLTPEDDRAWNALLHQEPHLQNQKVVCLSPTHRRPHRRWPWRLYAALAKRIVDEGFGQVLWLWGPGELEFVRSIQQNCSVPTALAPDCTLRELAAIIKHSYRFLGNSNGPSHLAVAVGTPSLQLHGHTDGRSWCPNTDQHRFLQSPDFNPQLPPEAISMDGITLADAWNSLCQLKDG